MLNKKNLIRSFIINAIFCLMIFFCNNSYLIMMFENNNSIVILYTNDVHGRFKNVYKGDSLDSIGLETLSGAKKSLEKIHKKVFLIDGGDAVQGTPFCLMRPNYAAELMRLAGYDLKVLGNHEFDLGKEKLVDYVKNSKCPFLGANVVNFDGIPLLEGVNNCNGENYILEINGKKIGFFGITTEESTRTTPPMNINEIKFEDEMKVASEQVKKLKNDGADLVVAITHLGIGESTKHTSKELAEKVSGIDIILDGHSHSKLLEFVNGVHILQTGAYSKNLGKVEIKFNNDSTQIIPSILSAEEVGKNFAPNKEISDYYDKFYSEISPMLEKVVGKISSNMFGGTYNGQNVTRISETNLGNLITDSMLEYGKLRLKDTEYKDYPIFAFDNGGAVRSSIKRGYVTYGDLLKVLPSGNNITFQVVTPKQIYEMFERGVGKIKYLRDKGYFDGAFGGFPQVSGIKIDYDISLPGYDYEKNLPGSRVLSVSLVDSNCNEYKNLSKNDENTKIILLFNDWAINEFPSIANVQVFKKGEKLVDILSEYIRNKTFEGNGEFNCQVKKGRVNMVTKDNEVYKFDSKILIKDSSDILINTDIKVSIDGGKENNYRTDKDGEIIIFGLNSGNHIVKISHGSLQDEILVSNFLDLKNNIAFLNDEVSKDTEKVENIIGQIPQEIRAEDYNLINFARKSYNSLLPEFRNKVVNYPKLQRAEKEISRIRGKDFSDIKNNKTVIAILIILSGSLIILVVLVLKRKKSEIRP